MTDYIAKYQYLIETLASESNHTSFAKMLEEKTPGCSEEVRFLLMMEIRRLAIPCLKPVDLRLLVDDDCEVCAVGNIEHYLSAEGKELFDYLMTIHKKYTTGVYEGTINYFTQQREIALGKTKRTKNELEDVPFAHTNIGPVESLLEYPIRQEERYVFEQEVRIFLSGTVALLAVCLDISQRGLRLQLVNETELTLIKGYRPVQIVFTQFDRLTKLHTTPIEYRVVRLSKGLQQAEIHLQRVWEVGPRRFNDYLSSLLTTLTKTKKMELSNTRRSIETRIYEQSFANNCQGISLFINTKKLGQPFVEYACVNDSNLEIVDYWQDEKNNQTMGYLFSEQRIKKLLLCSDSDESLIVYCFTHLSAGKVYFYSATHSELDNSPELKEVFLSYASRKLSWRVYNLSVNQISYTQAELPNSLPDNTIRGISQVSKRLSPRLTVALENLTHLLTLTDITHSVGQQCYQQRELANDRIKLLALFGHARNRIPPKVETLKFEVIDKRRERRYKLRTEISVGYNEQTIVGSSEDISVTGLRIELDTPLKAKGDVTISVSFVGLNKITKEYDLNELPYQLIKISSDGYILHLQLTQGTKAKSAAVFFNTLIDKNKDKLTLLVNEESNSGLRQALRVLQAKFSPQICVFTRQQKDLHIPIKTSIKQLATEFVQPFLHRMPTNYTNLNSLFSGTNKDKAFITESLNQARKNGVAVNNEVYMRFDSADIDAISASNCKWDQELATHVERYKFIKESLENAAFFAYRITSVGQTKPQLSLYNDENNYLLKHDIKEAKRLEKTSWSFSGHLFITDITQEVLYRYRLINF